MNSINGFAGCMRVTHVAGMDWVLRSGLSAHGHRGLEAQKASAQNTDDVLWSLTTPTHAYPVPAPAGARKRQTGAATAPSVDGGYI